MRTTADVSKVLEYGRQLGGAGRRHAYMRAVVGVKRELEAGADEIVDGGKAELSRVQTQGSGSDGLAMQGIVRDREATPNGGGVLEILIGWTRPYGPILEYGPVRLREWVIQAKTAKALRWWSRGGGQAGSIRYAKRVRHVWDESQKRPHLVPATKRETPKIQTRIIDAAGGALSGRW